VAVRRDLLLKFGQLIREHRLEQERTQQDVAERLGISQPSYSAYETGLAFPTVPILLGLLRELEISLAALLGLLHDNDDGEAAA
jgi:transcriptional regulator with XRE-family HTH domain